MKITKKLICILIMIAVTASLAVVSFAAEDHRQEDKGTASECMAEEKKASDSDGECAAEVEKASDSNAEYVDEVDEASDSEEGQPAEEENIPEEMLEEEIPEEEYTESIPVFTEDGMLILPRPQKDGRIFVEWNTAEDGSGTGYKAGEIIDPTDIVLYAIWTDDIEVDIS